MVSRNVKAASGFTIIEAMIVVTIAAVLAAVALPAYNDFVRNQRVKNASFDLFSTLVLARSEAVTRNTAVTITPVSGSWVNGWTVTVGGTTLRKQNAIPSITITGAPASITYNGTGRITAAVTGIQLTATAADGTRQIQTRCIKVDTSGRPVTLTTACA
jgi:type IV fimbrial biogenesis protein FimT